MAAASFLTKASLRQQMKERLANMTLVARRVQSYVVANMVLESEVYRNAERICLYLSMDEEVSTYAILKDIFARGKQCFIPRYTLSTMEMLRVYSLEDFWSLPTTKWNIKQPETSQDREEALTSGGLDLMLVPGLAFTADGHRLGRGKGYYDKYLEKCKKDNSRRLTTIGLAFSEQVVDFIPTDELDMMVHSVLYPKPMTEKQIVEMSLNDPFENIS